MTYLTEWKILSARIQSLADASQFFNQIYAHYASDDYGTIKNVLMPTADKLFSDIDIYTNKYKKVLPSQAGAYLQEFYRKHQSHVTIREIAGLQIIIPAFLIFRSEFDALLSDVSFLIKRKSEHAFIHLQRSIIADTRERDHWKKTFIDGNEMQCEKLGACHLLLHGIWAFKANSEGERTDLILAEPVDLDKVESTADGLVLTEWKIVRRQGDLSQKIEKAHKQAKRYAGGSLAGVELRNYRYLVMVSEKFLDMPEDRVEEVLTYRLINIAVDPGTPGAH